MFSKKKIRKSFKRYFAEASKKIGDRDFFVNFYVIYSKKDEIVYFQPFASIDAFVAKQIALDMVKNCKLKLDLKDLAIFKIFTINYTNMVLTDCDSPNFECFLED